MQQGITYMIFGQENKSTPINMHQDLRGKPKSKKPWTAVEKLYYEMGECMIDLKVMRLSKTSI